MPAIVIPDGAAWVFLAAALTGLTAWATWMTKQAIRLTEAIGRLEERQIAAERENEDRDRRIRALESVRLTPAERRPTP